ncbi:hypothetical protein PHMEG_0009589 [Phytophthora megakarya]|uniref:Uncharacterized protein n=1 Tax=Phytophthora megakarya TaxID=4795 RepID=A0A225WG60_9STRA|nr:hypothetical protein PHMEG_0009589 [Phytophthora megakarya]
MNSKQADNLVRKKEVSFIAIIPPDTFHDFCVKKSDKAQRQLTTDMDSFKNNSGLTYYKNLPKCSEPNFL